MPPGADGPPRVSVIIPHHDGAAMLRDCLAAVYAQRRRPLEAIVVDDASADGSRAVAEAVPRPADVALRWIRLDPNRGFAAAANAGLRAARGDALALLNDDTIPDPGWIEALLSALQMHPEAGFFASRLVLADEPGRLDTAGHGFSRAGAGFARLRWAKGRPEAERAGEVFGACAAAALYRREALEAAGLLDEDFFMYVEDVDLDCRLQLQGYRARYVPGARVLHRLSASTGGAGSERIVYLSSRNQEWVYVQNLPGRLVWTLLPEHLLFTIGRGLVYLWKGRGRAFLRGKLDALRGLGRALAKRRALQARRRVTPEAFRARLERRWWRAHFLDPLRARRERPE